MQKREEIFTDLDNRQVDSITPTMLNPEDTEAKKVKIVGELEPLTKKIDKKKVSYFLSNLS